MTAVASTSTPESAHEGGRFVLRAMEDLPAGVIGVEAVEEVTASDYAEVLVPMIDAGTVDGRKVRLLYVLDDDVEMTAGGAWADTKLGISHLASFERIAVVTDTDWLEKAIKALGWMVPGEVRVFDDDNRDDAVKWLSQD
jgi:hypothetical protein